MILEKPFTTKPKTRRHGHFISGDRCRVFMEHCWERSLRKKASWETLEFEFTQCFETNESRTVHKYIGRPEEVVSHQASSVVRHNRTSGKVAQFNYRTTRKVSKKTGLLENLGYITYCGEGYYRLNHEMLPYYTEQTILEVSPHSPFQEVYNECVDVSIDDLRVCCGGGDADGGEVSANDSVDDLEKKEEEVIEGTRANPYLNPNMQRTACDVDIGGMAKRL